MVCFSSGKFSEEVLCVLAVRVVPPKTVEEVEETPVRSFLQMEFGQVHKLFGRGLNGLHGAPEKMGVFSRFVLFGVRKCPL